MAYRLAINGYGRIGQCVLRALYERQRTDASFSSTEGVPKGPEKKGTTKDTKSTKKSFSFPLCSSCPSWFEAFMLFATTSTTVVAINEPASIEAIAYLTRTALHSIIPADTSLAKASIACCRN